jgi:uncharacterized protein (DUF885 family)
MTSHLRMKIITILLLLFTVAAAPADSSEKLNQLFKREWEWTMEQSPTWASEMGDRRWNDQWGDGSLEASAKRNQHRKDVLKELDAIKPGELSPADRLNFELFRKQQQNEIQEFDFNWHLVPLNQRGGIQTQDELADQLRFQTVKDYEDWIARLNSFPTMMDQTIATMRAGIKAKVVHPKIVMQRVPAQIDKQIVDDPTTSGFYKPFKKFPESIPTSDRDRLQTAAAKAIAEKVIPSYQEFKKFFEAEYLPACFDNVGAWQLPHGDEMYAFFARQHTTTDLSPQQIHELGLSEVARIKAEMEKVKEQAGFSGSLEEFFTFLRTDKRFFYSNGDELLAASRALAKRIDPKLVKLFRLIPRMPYGVEPIPMNIAPDTTTAYYQQPAADGSRAGTYYVNLYKPETRPKWEMTALTLHEAVPGHHFQISRAMELGEQPEFRRYGGYSAFVEGWALYCESMGEEIGMYDDPYDRFGRLTYEMWRAVRLVVDTGIHYKHWTRQQAIDYFKSNAPKSELDITNEVDRYIAWPGQALAYKVGELKIKELRKKAETELGEKFDVRDFNDIVIGQGAVPLDELERIVNRWIELQKK